VVDALKEKRKVVVSIDLKPALDDNALNARLLRDFESHSNQKFKTVLNGLLPQKLIPVCISLVGIDADKPAHQITSVERKRLRLWLKDFQFEVAGHRTFDEAIITAGGVSTKEIDPRTMQSRLIQGLYLAGEVLDIDGDTGGYNLQAAFSTGWLAGRSVANSE
jgi:predicted Rossmann fold flavoprotein